MAARDSHFEAAVNAQLASAGLVPAPGATVEDKLRMLADGIPADTCAPDPAENVEDMEVMDEETFKNQEFARMAADVSDSDEDFEWDDEIDRRWQVYQCAQQKKVKEAAHKAKPSVGSKQTSADKDKKVAARTPSQKDSPQSSKGASSSGKRAHLDGDERPKKTKVSANRGKAKVTLQSPPCQNVDVKAKDASSKQGLTLSQGLITGIDLKLMQSILRHDLDGNLQDDMYYPLGWLYEEWKRKFKVLYEDDVVDSVMTDDEINGIVSLLLPEGHPSVISAMSKKFKLAKIHEHI